MQYRADRDLYLDRDGNIVESNNVAQHRLLIHQGGEVDTVWLEKWGCQFDDESEKILTPNEIPAEPIAEVEKPITRMNVDELKTFLTANEVEFQDTATKAELLELAKGVQN